MDQKNPLQKRWSVPPPAESLLRIEDTDSPWPADVMHNDELIRQAKTRLSLSVMLDAIYTCVPRGDTDLCKAIDDGVIKEQDAAGMYDALSNFLEDPTNDRLIFYLPFEFIPNCMWRPQSSALLEKTRRFIRVYMESWGRLLSVTDVRANFVDGDIPEEEIRDGPLPRVVKAAHMIPKLLEKGLISVLAVHKLMEDNPSSTLEASIADTLPVLTDMGFIKDERHANVATANTAARDFLQAGIVDLAATIQGEIALMIARLPQSMPVARLRWLTQECERSVVEKYAVEIGEVVITDSTNTDDLLTFASPGNDRLVLLTAIAAIRKIVEHAVVRISKEKGEELRNRYHPIIKNALKQNCPEVYDACVITLLRWHALGILQRAELEIHGIALPRLDAPFSKWHTQINSDIKEALPLIALIHSDQKLATYLYPIVILFGSRIKGYGTGNVDLDAAVFIKPGTPMERREHIQGLLQRILTGQKIRGKALEFWLADDGENLFIRDFPHLDTSLGDSTLSHVLFQGVWCGDLASIKKLHRNLLTGYLYSKGKTTGGKDSRSIWLEEMEHDTLQYRLMHKGYARFFPEQGGIHTIHSDRIDSKSMFWDSGYRRLATKLFVTKVFLPQLEKREL